MVLLAVVVPGLSRAATPVAEHGVIDLRGTDFARIGSVDLAGDWGIVLGSDSSRAFAWTVDSYLQQPGSWNDAYPGTGNAVMVLRVLLPESAPPLALAIPDINSAWRLHVDGVLVRSLGELGLDAGSEVPVLERVLVPLPLGRPFVDLVFEISNHHHSEGGITRAVRIGQAEVLALEAERLTALPLAAFGALLMITLMALAFYAGGKRSAAFLVFALFTALVAARTFAAAQLYVLIGHEMRADLWSLPVAYATLFVFPGIYFVFLRELLPDEAPRSLAWGGYGLSAVMVAVALFTPSAFYSGFHDLFMLLNLAAPVVGVGLSAWAIIRRRLGASWLMAGSLVLSVALANDILHYARIINSTDLVSVGFAAFASCYFAALALRMFHAERSASERLATLNHDLEGLVAARTASLAEALEVAERASKAKSEFLAVMSHEIRTPLHGWAGLTELLAQTQLDDQQRKYVRLLRRTAEQLSRLIGNILELAGMETGRVRLEPQPLRLDELTEEMAALVRGQAGDRGQGFAMHCAADLPAGMMADEGAVLQVLRTLLDRLGTASGDLLLGVSAPLPHLVVTLSGPARDDVESAGDSDIGQALCRNLVEAMGGELSIRRQDNHVEAWLRLPLSEALPPEPRRQDQPRHVRVLLADDVELNRLVLRGFLSTTGWSVDEAADGRQAVAMVEAGRYDLIVLDLRMPVMDGFAAARAIRQWAHETGNKAPPLVALSAGAAAADRQQAEAAGFTIFLAKPIGPDALVASLSALLPATSLPPPPSPPSGLEGLMPAFLAEMDKDAVLLQELQAGDRFVLIDHVHAMRGKCGMFGENLLFDLLSQLEQDIPAASQQEISAQVVAAVERVSQLRQYQ
ncbi:response regulator [Magnetospirillum sulfuroxidans]|nr:response regulator [Magnetospirillum sulfuroxidans]